MKFSEEKLKVYGISAVGVELQEEVFLTLEQTPSKPAADSSFI